MRLTTRLLAATALTLALGTAASAKTLVYCSEGSPEGFDPALYTAGTTFDASSKTIYNRLVEFELGTTNIKPGLAESWEVSDDGLEYTFNLRPDAQFHTTDFFTPSRPLTADDVVFSFDRQNNAENPYNEYVTGAAWEYWNSMSMPDILKSIEKVDDQTVKFTLNEPYAPFLANLAMDFASIASKEYADQLAEAGNEAQLNQQPIGTGPFQFVAYQPDAVIRYRAHPDYWNGKEAIDDLVFAITTDASVRQQRLLANECQVMPYPNPADIESLKGNENLTVMEQEGLNVGYLAYNTQIAPFDNAQVRKALNMAINKQAIIDVVFQGSGEIAKNPIPPTMWSYREETEDDAYDPEAAQQMLEEAGVTDLSMEVWAMPVQRPYNPNARRMAELIQADFSKIGVDVEIVSYEWGEYLERSKAEDREGAVLLGWTGDNGDPDNFLAVLLGCDAVGNANRAQWCNEEFDAKVTEAKRLDTQEERAALYKEAQAIFKEEAPWATIAHSVTFMPMQKNVTGYVQDPLGGHWFTGVDIAE
ncbi:ABC peptide transporter, periplasmic binding protein [Fulvimarina pelagi HTCC2506]|uniref:ABC peptide transporter, periplasmic binding protein n=1 Tax=Fulvimarina pelagi HTCC2506 TaxID=314231 RepID=Q0G772_9HYPH|nr:ABC transporter substrate-binding protein [Fulvimarina pelagi]EAU42492.1 ABC peptide transporter, periplasmic binding protein [Fulvimarina pelagi HTCC2506]